MRRYISSTAILIILMAGVFVLSGCGGSPSSGSSGGSAHLSAGLTEYGTDVPPEQGDWLIRRLPAEMPHLNPLTSSDAYATIVMDRIFDSLLFRDPMTLELKPSVATEWTVSDDHLVYTFKLRTDVTFSDGVPLTAHDVKFTFDKLMDPTTDAPHLRNYFKDVTDCEVVDDHTVRFTCDQPYYLHTVILGLNYIMPKHIYGEGDFNNHPNNRNPIGSGMYVLEKWETGLQVVLARNERYWGAAETGMPHFDKIILEIILDDNAAFQKLSRGDLDMMGLRAEDWVRRADTPRFKMQFNKFAYNRPAFSYIGWNQRRPVFEDKRVRRALTMLLDRETIINEIYYGFAEVISGGFMPGTPEAHPDIVPLPFDPLAAEALLDEAGWVDSNGDSIRDKDGIPLRFEVFTTNQNPVAEKILTLYQEELKRHGIRLVIRQMEWASLLERVHGRDFDAMMMGWAMTPDPDPYQIWHSSQSEAGSNYIGFNNPEADDLIERARISFDKDERVRLYRRFHEIQHEEQPYTFLLTSKALLAMDKRVHNFRTYPFGLFSEFDQNWFVPKALQRYGQ